MRYQTEANPISHSRRVAETGRNQLTLCLYYYSLNVARLDGPNAFLNDAPNTNRCQKIHDRHGQVVAKAQRKAKGQTQTQQLARQEVGNRNAVAPGQILMEVARYSHKHGHHKDPSIAIPEPFRISTTTVGNQR